MFQWLKDHPTISIILFVVIGLTLFLLTRLRIRRKSSTVETSTPITDPTIAERIESMERRVARTESSIGTFLRTLQQVRSGGSQTQTPAIPEKNFKRPSYTSNAIQGNQPPPTSGLDIGL